jgi:DNA-binding transcriptional ArsR family regulator
MNYPQPPFIIETVEQLRAIADPLRQRIIELLMIESLTATQLAERLGEAPAKVHYHVRELERVGLILLAKTQKKGGILENYYHAISGSLSIASSLIQSAPADDTLAALQAFLDIMTADTLEVLRTVSQGLQEHMRMTREISWMTYDEWKAFNEALKALLAEYEVPRGVEGERQWTFNLIMHPSLPHQLIPTEAVPSREEPKEDIRRMIVIGVLHIGRATLEDALTHNARLDIVVLGVCIFAKDVSADLIQRAVRSARITGRINASDDVRAALQALAQ